MRRHGDPLVEPSGEQLYYLLDCRSAVGNCALWWRPNGKGYCCELREAGLYTEVEAFGHRDTDIPVPREVAEGNMQGHVCYERMRSWAVENLPKKAGKKWHR